MSDYADYANYANYADFANHSLEFFPVFFWYTQSRQSQHQKKCHDFLESHNHANHANYVLE